MLYPYGISQSDLAAKDILFGYPFVGHGKRFCLAIIENI
jgi:hypothetical protein